MIFTFTGAILFYPDCGKLDLQRTLPPLPFMFGLACRRKDITTVWISVLACWKKQVSAQPQESYSANMAKVICASRLGSRPTVSKKPWTGSLTGSNNFLEF